MEYVRRTSIMYLLIYWTIGISYWVMTHLLFNNVFSTSKTIVGLLLIILLCVVCMALLLKSLLKGWQNYRKHVTDARFWSFLFSETPVSFEDERSRQINTLASQKSYTYAEVLICSLFALLLLTGQSQVTTEVLVFWGLVTLTLRQLAYWLIWRREYLK